MTGFDVKLRAGMEKLRSRIPKQVSIVPESFTGANAYNPETGLATPDSNAPLTVELMGVGAVKDEYIQSGTARVGDTTALLSASHAEALSYTPVKGDRVTWDSTTWSIFRVDRVEPAGQLILYKLFLRRA